jgi:hypothetical protein
MLQREAKVFGRAADVAGDPETVRAAVELLRRLRAFMDTVLVEAERATRRDVRPPDHRRWTGARELACAQRSGFRNRLRRLASKRRLVPPLLATW